MKKIIIYLLLFWPLASQALVPLDNPINAKSIPQLVGNVVKGLLGVSGSLALFFLVWGGIVWMTSGGSPDKVRKGKDTIVWAIFGLAVIFFSYAIIKLVLETLIK